MSTKVIDVHAHLIPPKYCEYLGKNDALKEDGVPQPAWEVDSHLEMMDKCGIDYSLLTVSSPHPYFGDDQACQEITRYSNEYCAELKQKYPEKFGFSACVPLPNIEASIAEIAYAYDALHADGIKLPSNCRGMYLGDPAMEPMFEELNKRKAVITIHPHRPTPTQENVFSAGPIPLFEFLADTTRAVLNMIGNGVFDRYKDIAVIVPHCGSFLPNIKDRFFSMANAYVPRGIMKPVDIEGAFSRLYYDIAGNPLPVLMKLLLSTSNPSKLMYGSDTPFTPTMAIQGALNALRNTFDHDESLIPYREMILEDNAKALFGLK